MTQYLSTLKSLKEKAKTDKVFKTELEKFESWKSRTKKGWSDYIALYGHIPVGN